MRILYLEYLRVVCAIAVVMNHAAIVAIHYFSVSADQIDLFVYNCFPQWSHFAVPVFLMISGYLLLDPAKPIDYTKAIGKYAKRMAIVLLLIGSLYAYMELFFASRSFSLADIGRAVYATLMGKTWEHMWYLYTLIGIYLALPVLKPIYQSLSKRTIDCFLIILFFFHSLLPVIESGTGFSFGVPFPLGTIFLSYFLLGGRLRTLNRTMGLDRRLAVILLMLLPIVFTYCHYMLDRPFFSVMSSYASPVMLLLAMSVFLLFRSKQSAYETCLKTIGGGKIMRHVAENSFGIYVFHMLWVNLLYKVVGFNPLEHSTFVLIPVVILVLFLSDLTTILFKKLPLVGKYI